MFVCEQLMVRLTRQAMCLYRNIEAVSWNHIIDVEKQQVLNIASVFF